MRPRCDRLEIIDNAGHLPNIEQPAAFDDLVIGFLREVSTARQTAATAP
ncbi:MAG: hypothetical protein AAFW98_12735 [Pseudomonadota bacterium]